MLITQKLRDPSQIFIFPGVAEKHVSSRRPVACIPKKLAQNHTELDLAVMFDRLIIGPSPYPLAMYEAFKGALTAAGVADAGKKIFASGIPIRT